MELLFICFKKRKVAAFIPIFLTGILIPLLCYHYSVRYAHEPEQMAREVLALLHTCVPLSAAWWIILLYQDFFGQEGNELLYYYYPQRELIKEYALVLAAYGALAGAVFIGVKRIARLPLFVLLQLEVETLCVAALTFFCTFFFLNTGGSLLITAAYCIYINLFDTLGLFQFMSVFPDREQYLLWDSKQMWCVLAAAAVLDVLGGLCMRYRRKYK